MEIVPLTEPLQVAVQLLKKKSYCPSLSSRVIELNIRVITGKICFIMNKILHYVLYLVSVFNMK